MLKNAVRAFMEDAPTGPNHLYSYFAQAAMEYGGGYNQKSTLNNWRHGVNSQYQMPAAGLLPLFFYAVSSFAVPIYRQIKNILFFLPFSSYFFDED